MVNDNKFYIDHRSFAIGHKPDLNLNTENAYKKKDMDDQRTILSDFDSVADQWL